jgi:hypothetical protein
VSRRAVVRWAAVACVCSAPAQAQLRPTVRMERADGTAGARNTIRLQLPLAWQISTPWSLRYLLAAEVGERLRSTPALDQSVRLTRNPASARRGWQLTSMLRAGRISALDLAADSLAAGDVPGSLGTLASLWRVAGSLGSSARRPIGARATGVVSAQLDATSGLGADRDLAPSRQRVALSTGLVSHLSRNETHETRIMLVDERRAGAAPLQAIRGATTITVAPRRAISMSLTGGVQRSRVSTADTTAARARSDVVGDAELRWGSPAHRLATFSLSTDVRLDPQRATARRQWNADIRGEWPVSPAWRISARARQALLTGNGSAQGTRTVELLASTSARPGGVLDLGVRVMSTEAPSSPARTVLSTPLRDLRVFASWTRGRR